MPWAMIDDHLFLHPKVQRAWQLDRASLGLHMLALSYSNCYLRDGKIDEEFIRTQIPVARERKKTLDALANAGLWERNGDRWLIHDYLEFNKSRNRILEERNQKRRAGKMGAQARWSSNEE